MALLPSARTASVTQACTCSPPSLFVRTPLDPTRQDVLEFSTAKKVKGAI